jgi:hypothetical protein
MRRAEERYADIQPPDEWDAGDFDENDLPEDRGIGGGGVLDEMGDDLGGYDGELGSDPDDTQPLYVAAFAGAPARLFRPFDLGGTDSPRRRSRGSAFPFLALVGYWAVLLTLALTMAGEKMPWLTTHLTVPMILLSGWWLGSVFEGIRWSRLREGGWLVLLVAMPLAFMGFAQVVLGFWGQGAPFRGREIGDLIASGNWLSALLVFVGALYLVGRFGNRLGWRQLGHGDSLRCGDLAILCGTNGISVGFVNYDYATEYLVYAHSGPAVKP